MTRRALNSWVIFPRPNPSARLRLFCFPYAGGGATIFSAWWRSLPADVEVVAVQPPGRESRLAEKPYADLMELVAALHRELLPHFDRPFAFYGHSNGGLMAFELARALRRSGGPMPAHLFIGGRPAPQVQITDPPIHPLPDDEFIGALRRYSGTPEEILQNAEIMQLIMPVLRADFSLGETYRYTPEPPLDVPISAYGGRADDEVTPEQVEAWGEQTTAAFTFRMFPGNHFFVNGDRAEVLAEMSRDLQRLLHRTAVHGY